jgi:iron complex transport system substrate-binding protein
MDRTGLGELDAVRADRVHAIWHHFYNSPFNVAAVQAMAAWFHPELFADVDANATLAELYARFQPVPLDGVYWISLTDGALSETGQMP